jgi:Sulfotransferase family
MNRMLPEMVFILAPPRSFTSVTCGMLGQHPQLFGLPELRLFVADTIGEWLELCSKATYPMASGTLRTVAELIFGQQSERSITMAREWLTERSNWSTHQLTKSLSEVVHPRILVDKSPNALYEPAALARLYRDFPNAKFIHLTRHPRGHGESVMKLKAHVEKLKGPITADHWLIQLSSFPAISESDLAEPGVLDPQRGWYTLHSNVCRFLESVPAANKFTLRGEDLLADADTWLRTTADWLGLRSDAPAVEAMKHPENSPFVGFGPKGASRGNDPFFLRNPVLQGRDERSMSLEGPLGWRADGRGFLPEVKTLARRFHYS